MHFEKHVFICANDKDAPKKCCGSGHGMELGTAKIRVQKSGCLDFCGKGPTMVVYPEGVFYGNVQVEDVAEITKSHLIEDEIVTRLQIQ
ncbi:MAG: hypothetical protein RI950_1469 [Bacteroidota bacterium]